MAVNGITEIEDEAFEVVHTEDFHPIPTRPTELLVLNYWVDRDLVKVQRAVYDTFMLLGDVGGLNGLLVSLGAILLSFLNFQKAENQIATELF